MSFTLPQGNLHIKKLHEVYIYSLRLWGGGEGSYCSALTSALKLQTADLYNRIRLSCCIMRFIIIDMHNSNHVLCWFSLLLSRQPVITYWINLTHIKRLKQNIFKGCWFGVFFFLDECKVPLLSPHLPPLQHFLSEARKSNA